MNQGSAPKLTDWLETQRELMLLMAHDLRNPLAAVLANLDFLELACRPDDRALLEAVGDIKISTDLLLRLIENLVAIARLEVVVEGGVALDVVNVDVALAAHNTFRRMISMVEAAGVNLELVAPAEGIEARGDPALIEQVVESLMVNVSQHVRRGQHAQIRVSAQPGGGAVIALDDDGPAFGPALRDFTREGQLEIKKHSNSRYSRGLALYLIGLGIRAMGGTIDVSGTQAKGHVRITLPAQWE